MFSNVKYFLVLLVAVSLVGCSSTKPTATSSDPATSEPATATETPTSTEESSEADPTEASEDWHRLDATESPYPGIGVERAYRQLLNDKRPQDTVLVAVIDNGMDLEHEDLDDVVWTNEDEIAGNEVDDDENGYVDDMHGWNFIGGPDGQNVDHDTYELTRIYARLKPKYEDATDPSQLSPAAREEYAYYQKIKADYERKVQELKQQINQMDMMQQAVRQASQILKTHLDVDSLTKARVKAIDSSAGQRVQQARGLMMRMYQYDVSPNAIDKQKKQLQDRLEYGYNLDFDPRHIVGDDYDDLDERYYGNNAVSVSGPYHGTVVAGIIGAERDNEIGTRGIADAVRLMPIRAVPDGDERDKDVANAIRYAVDNGADIINMSFGKGYSPQKETVDEAVRYADQQGVLMVHAAGNEGANIDTTDNFPTRFYRNSSAAAEHWIEVGASSWRGEDELAAPFSNYGAKRVDLFAPGVSIYSTAPGQEYEQANGTSMAAPVVTGVAALLMSYYPSLSVQQVREVLLSSAATYDAAQVRQPGTQNAQVTFDELSATGGIVNAYEALKKAAAMVE